MLTADYGSADAPPPHFTLASDWLDVDELTLLAEHLQTLALQNSGC